MRLIFQIPILRLIIFFAVLFASIRSLRAQSSPAQTTQLISFSGIATTEADRMTLAASKLFPQTDDSGIKFCSMAFRQRGMVRDLTSAGYKIEDKEDLDRISSMPALVKIVAKIDFCAGKRGSFAGCTAEDPNRHNRFTIMIVPGPQDVEGIVLIHEYGHVKGLYHTDRPNAVMQETVSPNNTRIDRCECAALRRSHPANDPDVRTVNRAANR